MAGLVDKGWILTTEESCPGGMISLFDLQHRAARDWGSCRDSLPVDPDRQTETADAGTSAEG